MGWTCLTFAYKVISIVHVKDWEPYRRCIHGNSGSGCFIHGRSLGRAGIQRRRCGSLLSFLVAEFRIAVRHSQTTCPFPTLSPGVDWILIYSKGLH